MSITTPATGGKTTAALKDQLDSLQRELAHERTRTSTGSVLTVLMLIVLGAVAAYFAYGYHEISKLTDHDQLVDVMQDTIQSNLPSVRKSLEKEIADSAPSLAVQLSKNLQESLPTGRKKFEEVILEQSEQPINQATGITQDQFREFIRKNRPALEQKFKELATSPQLAEASLAEVQVMLDDQIQSDMKGQAKELLQTLNAANQKMSRLAAGKNLTEEEKLWRNVLMIARRLKLEQDDPSMVGKKLTEPLPVKPRSNRKAAAAAREGTKPGEKKDEKKPAADDKKKDDKKPAAPGKDEKKKDDTKPEK